MINNFVEIIVEIIVPGNVGNIAMVAEVIGSDVKKVILVEV